MFANRLPAGLIIASSAMRGLIEIILSTRGSSAPAMVTGETGTGKELIARAIHALSARNACEFIAFNCAAVSREIIESQLFGHMRGSFTGATGDFKGLFRTANGGTVFLDEIGEMNIETQPKLLRFLQDGEAHPVGSARPFKTDVRIIAATNRPIEEDVDRGVFRADLFERLNVLRLHIPPLRERKEEIPILIDHFLDRFKREMNKPNLRLSDDCYDALISYDWPRNVRELCNEVHRLVLLSKDKTTISIDRLTVLTRKKSVSQTPPAESVYIRIDANQPYAAARDELERQLISRAIEKTGGNLSRAALQLGMDRSGLSKAIKRLNLKCERRERETREKNESRETY